MNAGKKLKNLMKLFKSGAVESLDDLQNRTESLTEKILLRRASLLGNLDEAVFAKVFRLTADAPKISFDRFTRHPDLEAVPRTHKVFRVRENVRQKYLPEWSANFHDDLKPDDAVFLKNLIAYYKSGEPNYELELLGVLILADPPLAQEKFIELFKTADKKFDLAGCNDVLRVLEERQTLLKPGTIAADELNKLCIEKRQYLKARSLFAAEHNQTVFYYARRQIVEAFKDLLREKKAADSKRIFHLYATGGMGKTMFVRWLIARYCVPEPQKIPVARLDFDFLHLPTVERFPWLLILGVAEQLNQQIAGSPFNEHLRNYLDFASLVRPPKELPGDDQREKKEAAVEKISPAEVDTIVRNFITTLKNSNREKPFVVVLDTLERMVLHYKNGLLAIIKLLDRVHGEYSQTRILLAGRYNMHERFTEFKTQFQDQTVVHELTRFDLHESRVYLAEKRGLQDAAIVEAIIEKCEENETGEQIARRRQSV